MVVDRHVQLLPADPPVAVRPTDLGAEHALGGSQKRPSCFVSTWSSSPGRARS
jgi:hypothetical protein